MQMQRLAEMGWHCITLWECELKPQNRNQTLTALEYTLNTVFLKNHAKPYMLPHDHMDMAAETMHTTDDPIKKR